MKPATTFLTYAITVALLTPALAAGADKSKPPTAPVAAPAAADEDGAEQVNVEKIKQKYWARGDESELGVVQNRLYSKAGKVELGAFGGVLFSDSLLNVQNAGGSVGYHFSEYLSGHLLGWKDWSSVSSTFTSYQNTISAAGGIRATPSINPPKSYYGGEVRWSFLYGKLSLVGKQIIYYDFNLLGGLGLTNTETGNYFTPHIGLGQKVYLSKSLSLDLVYRLMSYGETTQATRLPSGTVIPGAQRQNFTNSITLGISFMFGAEGK